MKNFKILNVKNVKKYFVIDALNIIQKKKIIREKVIILIEQIIILIKKVLMKMEKKKKKVKININ